MSDKHKTLGLITIKQVLVGVLLMGVGYSTFSQDLTITYQQARSFYEKGLYNNARKTFQRVIYFSDDTLLSQSYRLMGHCYAEENKYETAIRYYNEALEHSTSDSVQTALKFEKIKSRLLQRKYGEAQGLLQSLSDTLSPTFQQKRNFYAGISYFGLEQFDTSHYFFKQILPDTAQQARQTLATIFEQNKKIDRLNPRTARIMSLILPGLGQFYAGDIKNGINSLLLTSSFLAIGINTATRLTILDALIGVYPWFMRYYMGGYQKAGKIVERKIQKQRKEVYNRLIETISEAKGGN